MLLFAGSMLVSGVKGRLALVVEEGIFPLVEVGKLSAAVVFFSLVEGRRKLFVVDVPICLVEVGMLSVAGELSASLVEGRILLLARNVVPFVVVEIRIPSLVEGEYVSLAEVKIPSLAADKPVSLVESEILFFVEETFPSLVERGKLSVVDVPLSLPFLELVVLTELGRGEVDINSAFSAKVIIQLLCYVVSTGQIYRMVSPAALLFFFANTA